MAVLKKWLWIPGILFMGLVVFSFMPLPKAKAENCTMVKAVVEKVEKGSGEADIVLRLAGDDGYYYINRGMEKGLQLEALVNKPVELYYIKHWSLLNINGNTRHVAKLTTGEQVLYAEF